MLKEDPENRSKSVCCGSTLTFFFLDRSPLTGSSPPPLNRRTFGPFDLDNVFVLRTSGLASTRCAPGLLGAAGASLPVRYGIKRRASGAKTNINKQDRVRSPNGMIPRPFPPNLTVRTHFRLNLYNCFSENRIA